MRDAIVVGAGPSGSYLSYELSRMGYDVLNLEEHNEVGKPVECTGLVSERVFRYVKSRAKVNSVSGAHIYFPNGEEVHPIRAHYHTALFLSCISILPESYLYRFLTNLYP